MWDYSFIAQRLISSYFTLWVTHCCDLTGWILCHILHYMFFFKTKFVWDWISPSSQPRPPSHYWELFSGQWKLSYVGWQEKLGRTRICLVPHTVILVLMMPGNVSRKLDTHSPVTPTCVIHRYCSCICFVCSISYNRIIKWRMIWSFKLCPQFSFMNMTKAEPGKEQI